MTTPEYKNSDARCINWEMMARAVAEGRRRIVDQGVYILTILQLQQQGHLLRKTRPRKLNGSLSQPRKSKLF